MGKVATVTLVIDLLLDHSIPRSDQRWITKVKKSGKPESVDVWVDKGQAGVMKLQPWLKQTEYTNFKHRGGEHGQGLSSGKGLHYALH